MNDVKVRNVGIITSLCHQKITIWSHFSTTIFSQKTRFFFILFAFNLLSITSFYIGFGGVLVAQFLCQHRFPHII
jgi:hypothetical protein